MSWIHFTSTDWWLDVLSESEDRSSIRLQGKADFRGRKDIKMQISLFHKLDPILEHLEIKPQDSYVEKIKDLLQQKTSEGFFTFHNKNSDFPEDFISADVLISKSAWQSIYEKINNPPPLCLISLGILEGTLLEINPVTRASIHLKYQN